MGYWSEISLLGAAVSPIDLVLYVILCALGWMGIEAMVMYIEGRPFGKHVSSL